MKVRLITNKGDWSAAKTGKGKFISRLMPELEKLGVKCVNDMSDVDIDMQLGKYVYEPKNCKKSVVRFGAAHIGSNEDYKRLNKRKTEAMKKADGVIYQSDFSRKMCNKFIGKPSGKQAIIFNGANPEDYNVKPFESTHKKNFIASTRAWLPRKRLKDIVKSFAMADIEAKLFVCGSVNKKYEHKNVEYMGQVDDNTLYRLLRLCDTMIHLCWLDACPNAVVEAICAGCSVVTTDCGGQGEFVEGLKITEEWDFKPVNLNKPPKINRQRLARLIRLHYENDYNSGYDVVSIDNIAKQYKAFFKDVLNG